MNFAKFLDWHGDLCQHNAAFKKEVFRRPSARQRTFPSRFEKRHLRARIQSRGMP
jgi:hypothetical protein